MKYKPRNLVIDWMNTIWKTDLPHNAKYLACYLRSYMNDQRDIAWPSYSRIIGETGLGRATVAKYLDCLEREGWIRRERGKGVSTTYIATFPKVVEQANKRAIEAIETSSGGELPEESSSSGGEPTSSGGELQLVREANTNKQGNKQLSNQVPFERFWEIYPKKADKPKTQKKWDRLKPDDDLFKKIRANIQARLDTGEWSVLKKQYIPNPLTYLNGERWNDEVIGDGPPSNPFAEMEALSRAPVGRR